MFDIGFQELVIIFLVALLVFGPKKLPEVGRTFGKWIMEIRKGIHNAKIQMDNEFDDAYKKEVDDIMKTLPGNESPDAERDDEKVKRPKERE